MVLVASPRALLNGFTFSFLNGEEGVSVPKSGSNLDRCGVGRGFGMGAGVCQLPKPEELGSRYGVAKVAGAGTSVQVRLELC